MEHLRGTLIHYPWGTFDTIHELLGTEPDVRPEAEFWLGAHTLAPSSLADATLDQALAQRPELLGARSQNAQETLQRLQLWCHEAEASGIRALEAYAARLRGYALHATPA